MNDSHYLGVFVTKQSIANMEIEHVHVPDYAIQQIIQSIRLTEEAQDETVSKLIERTPGFFTLDEKEKYNKMKIALTQETVVEYLRLHELIRSVVDMIEVGIDEEGTIIVSAYYIDKHEEIEELLKPATEEEIERMEREMNIFNSRMDLIEEAQKKLETLKQAGQIIPFQNRAERRKAKKVKVKKEN